jgi:four helix bundle protein
MDQEEMKMRTRKFALRVIHLVQALPRGPVADTIGRQVLRSGTSVGANYRSARRARSNAEFLSRLGVVEEEADETAYWLELMAESGVVKPARLAGLMDECDQIVAIVVATIKSARRRKA